MLFMDGPRDQRAIGPHHKTAHLCVQGDISHTGRNQQLLIDPANPRGNRKDIIRLLLRPIGYPDSAGEIDKAYIRTRRPLKPHCLAE